MKEPWKDIDPGMIEWDRQRQRQREERYPVQVPLYDYVEVPEDREPAKPARVIWEV